MDPHSYEVLEFDKVKNIIAGFTTWSKGREFVFGIEPYNNLSKLNSRRKEVREAILLEEKDEHVPIEGLNDISELLYRAGKGGILSGEDLVKVQKLLEVSGLLPRFFSVRKDLAPTLNIHAQRLYRDSRLLGDLRSCLTEEGRIKDSASKVLSGLRREIKRLEEKIREKIEQLFRSSIYQKMLQEPLVTAREGRWVVPVKSEFRSQFPGLLIDRSSSGATVFMEPWLVVDIDNRLREARVEEKREEEKILSGLSRSVGEIVEELDRNLGILAHLDLVISLGKFALKYGAVLPGINTRGHLNLVSARHPLLTVSPVPINVELGGDYRTLVLTGPNTGGKTVTLKTVGLLSLMALSGMPIPADEKSSVPLFSNIFADIGDEQSIFQNLSTFSSHIIQLIRFLERTDENTLVLIDELGAGTDPVEGTALGIAILEYLHNKGARTLVSTHYGEIKSFAAHYPGVQNAAMEFDEETLRPTFRIKVGIP
ncbi:MAG: endonuclease MutS2, partial [Candidatus Eremiobacteraeota bacterium]|nr:endonuclease MutS2 [Candidatus Eremiobacteraeota bacterium]